MVCETVSGCICLISLAFRYERHPGAKKINMVAADVGYEKYWHHPCSNFVWRQARLMKQVRHFRSHWLNLMKPSLRDSHKMKPTRLLRSKTEKQGTIVKLSDY